jgi:hypothetical protein
LTKKILLIGQSPSKTGDPDRPLEGRIARIISDLAEISVDRYIEETERINLFLRWTGRTEGLKGDSWNALAARRRAEKLEGLLLHRHTILLGRNVSRAFGLKRLDWFTWIEFRRGTVAVIPHPSGIVRWWNLEMNRRSAGAFLSEAFRANSCEQGGLFR